MPQHPALSKGGVAVITGGASGIGLAAARRFAAFGMKLVLADLSQDALDRAAAQLSDAELVAPDSLLERDGFEPSVPAR